MSLPPWRSEPDQEDKASLLSAYELEDQSRHDSRSATPGIEPPSKTEAYVTSNGFLSAPLSGPIRPLSPDTLSNLSIDEYDQIRPSRSPSRHAPEGEGRHASQSPAPPPRGWRGRLAALWIRNKGLAYMLVAQIFGTLMNVTTRLLEVEGNKGKGLHPFQILFVRMGITCLLATGYMWYKKTPHFPFGMPEVRWLLVARGFGGFFGVFGMYYSLLYLPLADATVITFLAPSLACWACSILINEPFSRIEQVAALVSMVGVVLITRPSTLFAAFSSTSSTPATGGSDAVPTTNSTAPAIGAPDASSYESVTPAQRLIAVGVALLGVLGSATAFTTIRWIGKRAHPLLSVNYFAAWCTLVSIFWLSVLPDVGFQLPADLKEWGYLLFLGICGFVMQFLLAAGLAYEKSSRATNITYTQMLFALSADEVIFGHSPDLMSIGGSTLILGSAIYVATMGPAGKNSGDGGPGVKDETEGGDEESRQGLIGPMRLDSARELEGGEGSMPVQEVQMRTLR